MRETGASISQWAEETFGPAGSLARTASRALKEMSELVDRVTHPEPDADKIVAECADVVIVLARLAHRCGGEIFQDPDLPYLDGHSDSLIAFAGERIMVLIGILLTLEKSSTDHPFGLEYCRQAHESLDRACTQLGYSLCDTVDAKMTINRGREWVLDGTGHGQHVKKAAPEDPWSFGPEDQRCYTKTLVQDACMEPEEEARVLEALRKAGRLWE